MTEIAHLRWCGTVKKTDFVYSSFNDNKKSSAPKIVFLQTESSSYFKFIF